MVEPICRSWVRLPSKRRKIYSRRFVYCSGGLAIAVPGEIRAYEKAYKEFGGNVTWKELFEPTIRLCREGILVSPAQAAAIQQTASIILADPALRFFYRTKISLMKNQFYHL